MGAQGGEIDERLERRTWLALPLRGGIELLLLEVETTEDISNGAVTRLHRDDRGGLRRAQRNGFNQCRGEILLRQPAVLLHGLEHLVAADLHLVGLRARVETLGRTDLARQRGGLRGRQLVRSRVEELLRRG